MKAAITAGGGGEDRGDAVMEGDHCIEAFDGVAGGVHAGPCCDLDSGADVERPRRAAAALLGIAVSGGDDELAAAVERNACALIDRSEVDAGELRDADDHQPTEVGDGEQLVAEWGPAVRALPGRAARRGDRSPCHGRRGRRVHGRQRSVPTGTSSQSRRAEHRLMFELHAKPAVLGRVHAERADDFPFGCAGTLGDDE